MFHIFHTCAATWTTNASIICVCIWHLSSVFGPCTQHHPLSFPGIRLMRAQSWPWGTMTSLLWRTITALWPSKYSLSQTATSLPTLILKPSNRFVRWASGPLNWAFCTHTYGNTFAFEQLIMIRYVISSLTGNHHPDTGHRHGPTWRNSGLFQTESG